MVTPWNIVVGSLAYNEMGLVALFACAMVVGVDEGLSAAGRGAIAGVLVGAASCVKPTALLFAGVPVAVVLLGLSSMREWVKMTAVGAGAGVLVLAPWLVRNWLTSANPVFPFAAGWFANDIGGTGHWTAERVARFRSGHTFHGSLLDRLRMLVLIDSQDPAGARHRGMMHAQWGLLFPVTLAAGAVVFLRGRGNHAVVRVAALLCVALLAQLGLWLFATHLQSRFLIPLMVPAAMLVGLGVSALLPLESRQGCLHHKVVMAAAALVLLVQAGYSAAVFRAELDGKPNLVLVAGPGMFSGELLREELMGMGEQERRAHLWNLGAPEVFMNFALPRGSRVYLLSRATPLYASVPVLYNTTWDAWPLGDAIREFPGEPARWSERLRERGVTHVLVDFSELRRLTRSGSIDPAVTEAAVTDWLSEAAEVEAGWPEAGVFLVRPLATAASLGDRP